MKNIFFRYGLSIMLILGAGRDSFFSSRKRGGFHFTISIVPINQLRSLKDFKDFLEIATFYGFKLPATIHKIFDTFRTIFWYIQSKAVWYFNKNVLILECRIGILTKCINFPESHPKSPNIRPYRKFLIFYCFRS